MPKYFTANELVSLLDEAVSVWNPAEGGEERQPLLQEDASRFTIKTGEDGTEAGFEISFFDLDATDLEDRFKSYQQAHEFCHYLQTRSFSRQLNAGEPGVTKKIIRPRIIMMDNPREPGGFVYKVFIPAAYKDHLARFSQRTLYKRVRAAFLNAFKLRWTQSIFAGIFAFLQTTFLRSEWYQGFENANLRRKENLSPDTKPVHISTQNGNVLQGYEATFNTEQLLPESPKMAILMCHGNGEYAAHYTWGYGEGGFSIPYFRDYVMKPGQFTTIQAIDPPGYGLSTGFIRRQKDMEDAYFEAAKQLVDRGHTHVKLVGRSMSGYVMPRVALRLQQYVKKNNLNVSVTLFCERTGRSLLGTLVGCILNLFLNAKVRRLGQQWYDSRYDETVARAAHAKYKGVLRHPWKSLNPLQWIGVGLLVGLATLFIYPLALITGWQRSSAHILNKLEKGSYELFNGQNDGVISRVNLSSSVKFRTQRKINQLKRKLSVLEDADVVDQNTLNEIKHKRLKLWQLETQQLNGQGVFTDALENDEHNQYLSDMKRKVSTHDNAKLKLHASTKFRLFYRHSESVQPLKRQHSEYKHEHFGSFFKPSRKRKAAEFDQYHANKKARHAESAKIANEFFPQMRWTR